MSDRMWKIERFERGAWRDAVHEALPYTDRLAANAECRALSERSPYAHRVVAAEVAR